MMFQLSVLPEVLSATATSALADVTVTGISIDSRTTKPGDLFFAITGLQFDGHDFIEQAIINGAIAIVATREIITTVPVIYVPETKIALGQLATWWRQKFQIPIVGVTGSCGKTSTKAIIAHILALKGEVLATEGTLNNDIGVPLTLLRLRDFHQSAVIEMGANHLGEIAYLTSLVRPTTAVITNIAPAHLEGFGNLAGVAKAKSEIFQGLSANGTAIINLDSPFEETMLQMAKPHMTITFGFSQVADIWADHLQLSETEGATFMLHLPKGQSLLVQTPLLGKHNVANVLAAVAVAQTLGIENQQMVHALAHLAAVEKRLIRRTGLLQSIILDDSYNANPLSMRAALQVLSEASGPKIFIVGDMRELGSEEIEYHRQLGEQARSFGVNFLFGFGHLTQHTVQAFGANGSFWGSDRQALLAAIHKIMTKETTILVKGSKSNRMWEFVTALAATKEASSCFIG